MPNKNKNIQGYKVITNRPLAGAFRCEVYNQGNNMNTWPQGQRRAMTQSEHEAWNDSNYPGTLEICIKCDEPTENCEEDNILDDDGYPHCYDCALNEGLLEDEEADPFN